MFKMICALLKKKPKHPDFPVKEEVKEKQVKKPTLKKATTRKPLETHFAPAKKKAVKKANKRLVKLSEK
jgi:hypothetical protein